MKFFKLVSLLLVAQQAFAAHTVGRKIQATDIVNAAGVSVFEFPTSAPTAGNVCTFNSDGEATSSTVTEAQLLASILPTQIGQSGKYLTTNGSTTSWGTVTAPVWGAISGTLSNQTDLQTALNAKAGLTANTFTDTQTITKTALGTSTAAAVIGQNTTAAANNAQQVSPSITLQGKGWSGSASQTTEIRQFVLPVQNPSGGSLGSTFKFQGQSNSGGWDDLLDVEYKSLSVGQPKLTAKGPGEFIFNGNNSLPGTVDGLTLTNAGDHTFQSFKFGSTLKSFITANSNGSLNFTAVDPSATIGFFSGSLISSVTEIAQLSSAGIYNFGASANQNSVSAGKASFTPPATLTTYGSFGVAGKLITANYTAAATETALYCDTTTAASCTGTPTNACSSYSDSTSCDTHNAAGCSWAYGGNCADYNNTDQATCQGANAACHYDTSSCAPYASDEATCTSTAGCSYNASNDCSVFSDGSSCTAQAGCTAIPNDCSVFGDEGSCTGQAGCSWDGFSCSGTYGFASCSGTYATCDGTYFNGTCSGGTWGACTGSAACGNIGGSSACNAEPGCSWISALNITLPDISNPATLELGAGRVYEIKKINSGAGSVTVLPSGSDTIEGASSASLSSQYASVLLHPFARYGECSDFANDVTTCEAHTGCSFVPANCGQATDEGACSGLTGCLWDGATCTGSYSGPDGVCLGQYIVSTTWMKW